MLSKLSTQLEHKEEDQANELRTLFQDIEEGNENDEELFADQIINEIDVLNLPPRKEVHTKNKRTKIKLSKPLLRFLFTVIIVLAGLGTAIYVWQDEITTLLHKL